MMRVRTYLCFDHPPTHPLASLCIMVNTVQVAFLVFCSFFQYRFQLRYVSWPWLGGINLYKAASRVNVFLFWSLSVSRPNSSILQFLRMRPSPTPAMSCAPPTAG